VSVLLIQVLGGCWNAVKIDPPPVFGKLKISRRYAGDILLTKALNFPLLTFFLMFNECSMNVQKKKNRQEYQNCQAAANS
jgi:hypothetical protein